VKNATGLDSVGQNGPGDVLEATWRFVAGSAAFGNKQQLVDLGDTPYGPDDLPFDICARFQSIRPLSGEE
jgi:hypothetical protein